MVHKNIRLVFPLIYLIWGIFHNMVLSGFLFSKPSYIHHEDMIFFLSIFTVCVYLAYVHYYLALLPCIRVLCLCLLLGYKVLEVRHPRMVSDMTNKERG